MALLETPQPNLYLWGYCVHFVNPCPAARCNVTILVISGVLTRMYHFISGLKLDLIIKSEL